MNAAQILAVTAPTLLVIEDDDAVRKLLETALLGKGYRVVAVSNGLEGLKALEQERPQLIITDLLMPKLDGLTFVKAIKNLDTTKPIPVIVLTGQTDPKTMIEGISTGAKFYLSKPFRMDDLFAKVQKALGTT